MPIRQIFVSYSKDGKWYKTKKELHNRKCRLLGENYSESNHSQGHGQTEDYPFALNSPG